MGNKSYKSKNESNETQNDCIPCYTDNNNYTNHLENFYNEEQNDYFYNYVKTENDEIQKETKIENKEKKKKNKLK